MPQADGAYEKATGATINWNQFDGGADVIAAIASGSVDIGYVGSSPLTAAASRELPIETIFVVGLIAEAEALAVKGVTKPEDLAGKKIATPFVSTTHYSLLAALKHWNVDPEVGRDPQSAAAGNRRRLGARRYRRRLCLGSGAEPDQDDRRHGAGRLAPRSPTGARRPSTPGSSARISPRPIRMSSRAFVKVTGDAYAAYLANPDAWDADLAEAKKIAKLTGAKVEDVPQLLKGYVFPTLDEQASADFLGGGTVKAIAATSAFLKEQGKIPAVLPDYSPYVTTEIRRGRRSAK